MALPPPGLGQGERTRCQIWTAGFAAVTPVAGSSAHSAPSASAGSPALDPAEREQHEHHHRRTDREHDERSACPEAASRMTPPSHGPAIAPTLATEVAAALTLKPIRSLIIGVQKTMK